MHDWIGVDILPKVESVECAVECIHVQPCAQTIPVEINQALSSKKALKSSSVLHFEQGEDFVYLGVLCFPYWRKFNEN